MAPGVSVLLIPFFALGTLLEAVLNQPFKSFGVANVATPGQVVMVQLFSALCSAISTVYVYRLCMLLGSRKAPAFLAGLTYAFATPVWVFGKTLFAHTFSALFLVMAYYHLFQVLKQPYKREALMAGIFAAIALSVEYTNLLLILPGFLYLLLKLRKNLGSFILFITPLFLSGSLLLLYNYVCFKNPLTFPETYWIGYGGNPTNIWSRFSTPLEVGLQGLLLSPSRGLLLFSPIAALAIPSIYLLAKTKRTEATVLASIFLINLLVFAKWYMWNGGASYGPRFLIPSLPFLITPIFAAIEKLASARSRPLKLAGAAGFTALFAASAVIASIGAVTTPIADSSTEPFLTFLTSRTGYSTIQRGTLRDLLYTLLYDVLRSAGIPQTNIGRAFWIYFASIPIAACLLKILSVLRLKDAPSNSAPPKVEAVTQETALTQQETEEPQAISEPLSHPAVPPSAEEPKPPKIVQAKMWLIRHRLDLATLLAFWVLAFVLRIWNYERIPTPRSDELSEDNLALRILQGYYPITNNAKFMGAFYQYVLAAFYRVFGPVSNTARLMSVFFGTSTVLLTYLLAKDLYDRETALISVTLLSFSAAHILIASHVGWSASLTPFFGILTIYLVNKALKGNRRLMYLAAGLTAGIALQTHPSAIFLLLSLGAYLLSLGARRPLITRRKLLLLLAVFLGLATGYINMIYFNLVNPFGSVSYAENARWTGLSSSITWQTYLLRLQSLTTEYLRMLGDVMTLNESFAVIWPSFKACLYLALTVTAVIYALVKRSRASKLLLLTLGFAWLILPIGIKGYGFPSPWGGHYVQLLLPIAYILISAPLGRLLKIKAPKTRRAAMGMLVALCAYSAISSLWTLNLMYGKPP